MLGAHAQMASTYAPALRRKLREAGLQGSLDAGAFKRLLKYVDEVDGSLDELYALIDALKTGAVCVCVCAARGAHGGGARAETLTSLATPPTKNHQTSTPTARR